MTTIRGGCNRGRGDVDIDIKRNVQINNTHTSGKISNGTQCARDQLTEESATRP
jgi:hypothetical protein